MRAENDTQWAVIPQFADVARACSAAQSIEELVEHAFSPLAAWVGIDLISLTLIGPQSVVTVSNGTAPELLVQCIRTHAARCIGINATHPGNCEQIQISAIETGIARDDDGIEDDAQILAHLFLLWRQDSGNFARRWLRKQYAVAFQRRGSF